MKNVNRFLTNWLTSIFLVACCQGGWLSAQNEFYLLGEDVTVENGAEIYVKGDIHLDGGDLANSGTLEVSGDWYLENPTSRMSGTGTVRFSNLGSPTKIPQSIICNITNMTGPRAFYNLEVQNGSQLPEGLISLDGGNVEVTNQLLFLNNTRIRTSPFAGGVDGEDPTQYPSFIHISNPDPSSITGAGQPGDVSRYIEGRLRRDVSTFGTYSFPVGPDPNIGSSQGNQPATLTFQTSTSGVIEGSFSQSINGLIPGITACNASVNCIIDHGYWNLDLVSGTNGTFDLVLEPGNPGGLCPASFGDFVILKRPDKSPLASFDYSAATANVCGPGNQSAAATSIPRTGFTTFSDFAIGRFSSSLPVTLLTFRAIPGEDHIDLEWVTEREVNTDFFELERSTDGQLFQKLARLDGAGESDTPILYTYEDRNVRYNVRYYYRLKTVDADGQHLYSDLVEAILTDLPREEILLYPNPSAGDLTVKIFSRDPGVFTFRLMNTIGQEIFTYSGEVIPGENQALIRLPELVDGHYIAKIKTDSQSHVEKIIIRKNP